MITNKAHYALILHNNSIIYLQSIACLLAGMLIQCHSTCYVKVVEQHMKTCGRRFIQNCPESITGLRWTKWRELKTFTQTSRRMMHRNTYYVYCNSSMEHVTDSFCHTTFLRFVKIS